MISAYIQYYEAEKRTKNINDISEHTTSINKNLLPKFPSKTFIVLAIFCFSSIIYFFDNFYATYDTSLPSFFHDVDIKPR